MRWDVQRQTSSRKEVPPTASSPVPLGAGATHLTLSWNPSACTLTIPFTSLLYTPYRLPLILSEIPSPGIRALIGGYRLDTADSSRPCSDTASTIQTCNNNHYSNHYRMDAANVASTGNTALVCSLRSSVCLLVSAISLRPERSVQRRAPSPEPC
jgi:hypothetical protein